MISPDASCHSWLLPLTRLAQLDASCHSRLPPPKSASSSFSRRHRPSRHHRPFIQFCGKRVHFYKALAASKGACHAPCLTSLSSPILILCLHHPWTRQSPPPTVASALLPCRTETCLPCRFETSIFCLAALNLPAALPGPRFERLASSSVRGLSCFPKGHDPPALSGFRVCTFPFPSFLLLHGLCPFEGSTLVDLSFAVFIGLTNFGSVASADEHAIAMSV